MCYAHVHLCNLFIHFQINICRHWYCNPPLLPLSLLSIVQRLHLLISSTGSPHDFCTGHEYKEHEREQKNRVLTFYHPILIRIFSFHYATVRWITEEDDDKVTVVKYGDCTHWFHLHHHSCTGQAWVQRAWARTKKKTGY